MATQRWFLVAFASMLFGATAVTAPPETSAPEPIGVPVEVVPAPAPPPPAAARDRTYFLVVNGVDPLFVGKLNRYCDAIRCAGYKNVELYMLRNGWATERQICCIRQNDPGAKIVLVGYSIGGNLVRKVCNSLECQKVWVDMLVYIGCDYLTDSEKSRPRNAGRIVNINGHGFIGTGGDLLFNGAEISGAANYRVNARHFHLPKHPDTLCILLQSVAEMHAEKVVVVPSK